MGHTQPFFEDCATQWPQYVGFLQFHLTNARVMVPEQPVGISTRISCLMIAHLGPLLRACPSWALEVAANISGGSGLLPLATIGRHGLPAPSHPGCMHPMHADVTGCQHAQPLHLVGRRSMRSFYEHLLGNASQIEPTLLNTTIHNWGTIC